MAALPQLNVFCSKAAAAAAACSAVLIHFYVITLKRSHLKACGTDESLVIGVWSISFCFLLPLLMLMLLISKSRPPQLYTPSIEVRKVMWLL